MQLHDGISVPSTPLCASNIDGQVLEGLKLPIQWVQGAAVDNQLDPLVPVSFDHKLVVEVGALFLYGLVMLQHDGSGHQHRSHVADDQLEVGESGDPQ